MSLPVILLVSNPLISLLHARWAERLHLSLITFVPLAVAFFFLYRSSWHRESSTLRRILASLVSSCVIFGVDLVLVGILILLAGLVIGLGRSVGGN